jgi:hypothetical protein
MILCLTKKVSELFHVEKLDNFSEKDSKMWHVTEEFYDGKRLFIFTNVMTGYTLVFYGLKTKHFKNIGPFFQESLKKALLFDGFTPNAADAFITNQGTISLGKTNNRSIISNTTQRKYTMYGFRDNMDRNEIYQRITTHRVNQIPGIGYETPRELLERLIKTLIDITTSYEGYELDISIDLDSEVILRRVVVPSYYTLDDLHIVIQKLFGWKNSHLHAFTHTKSGKSYKPPYDDIDEYGQSSNSKSIALDQVFDKFDEWVYTYDFGDDWKHDILCRMSIHQPQPIITYCSHYDGNNIPENIGGIPGYQQFREILHHKDHQDYKSLKNWLNTIEYESFDIKFVNLSLKEEWSLDFKFSLINLFHIKKGL